MRKQYPPNRWSRYRYKVETRKGAISKRTSFTAGRGAQRKQAQGFTDESFWADEQVQAGCGE